MTTSTPITSNRPASHRLGSARLWRRTGDHRLSSQWPSSLIHKRRWSKAAIPSALLVGLALIAGFSPLVSGSPTESAGYVVAAGDNLSAISSRFGVTVSALAAANGISNPDLVDAGATLVIPAAAGGGTSAAAALPATNQSSPPKASYPPGLAYYPERLGLVPIFEQAASQAGIPMSLLEGITWQESGWQANVVSPAGAIGVGQLTPDTVAFVRAVLDPTPLDPWVANDNIVISAQYLRYLLDQTGWNERLAIAAYYQGLGAAQQYGILPVSRQYVADVTALQGEF